MPFTLIAFEQPDLFEQQLSELSARFVSLPAEKVDGEIDWALQLLVQALGIDRSSLAELSGDQQRIEVTHSHSNDSTHLFVQGDLAAVLPWYAARLRQGEILRFDRLPDDLPPEASAEREYCTRAGLRSQLTIPFRVGDRFLGAIGFASFHREVNWSPRVIRSLRLISEVFANAIARKEAAHAEARLREQLAHSARVNAVGEVVASIAHEVNQPLFAIVSNARAAGQLLAREVPDLAEIGAALEDIVQDANRASAVIARVRGFLQQRPTEHLPIDVRTVVETVVAFLGPELARRRVKVATILAEGLPPIRGDAVQLQQVVVNLLINGADAMERLDPKKRRIEVRTERDGAERVRIDVVDHGHGLDDASRHRLFEAFFTTKPQGLGMGLAICKSIVEAHGGRIAPLAQPGPGTTMQIWLPVHRA